MTWMEDLLTFVLHASGVEHSPQRRKLNFIGAQLTDDAQNEWTTVYIGNTNDWKGSVRVATTADLSATRTGNTLTAIANGNINTGGGIDGVTTLAVGDLFLGKNEAAGADNGIWRFTDLGTAATPWTADRATLANESVEVTPGLTTYVEEGTANGGSTWQLKTTNVILNTTVLEFKSLTSIGYDLISNADSPYNANLALRTILADSALGPITVNLPPAADWEGETFYIKDSGGNAAAQTITVNPDAAETIDGAVLYNITNNYRSVAAYSDGAAIHIVNRW